jgi:rhodanese-related sulfurtransferase
MMSTSGNGRTAARRAAAISILLAIAGAGLARAAGAALTVTPAQVAQWQEKGETFLFVDTRPQAIFDLKHARGAMNIPAFAFASKPLPRSAKLVLYDAGAGSADAETAARSLQAKGHPEFYVLEGGLTAWEAAGLPIVVKPGEAVAPLVEPIGAEDLLRLIDGGGRVAILDLRPEDLYKQSRVPGALRASTDALVDQAVAGLDPTALVVVYDDGGGESRDRAELLRRRGLRSVKYLYGGMVAWRQKNMRVER